MFPVSELISAASSQLEVVYFIVVTATTAIAYRYTTKVSPRAKLAVLRQLLKDTQAAHLESVDLLGGVPADSIPDDLNLTNMSDTTFTLKRFSSSLRELEGKLASAGIRGLYPMYLSREILVLSGNVSTAYENSQNTTKRTNEILGGVFGSSRKAKDGSSSNQNTKDGGSSGQDANERDDTDRDTSDGGDLDRDFDESLQELDEQPVPPTSWDQL